ncbi:hypothetical protein B0H13DRAFT_1888823 [Mycena leptocephala]|nr:hypothetical protein B0H13DRAFT_1888823 [Mycena leptocephala]
MAKRLRRSNTSPWMTRCGSERKTSCRQTQLPFACAVLLASMSTSATLPNVNEPESRGGQIGEVMIIGKLGVDGQVPKQPVGDDGGESVDDGQDLQVGRYFEEIEQLRDPHSALSEHQRGEAELRTNQFGRKHLFISSDSTVHFVKPGSVVGRIVGVPVHARLATRRGCWRGHLKRSNIGPDHGQIWAGDGVQGHMSNKTPRVDVEWMQRRNELERFRDRQQFRDLQYFETRQSSIVAHTKNGTISQFDHEGLKSQIQHWEHLGLRETIKFHHIFIGICALVEEIWPAQVGQKN